jgi:hypothetical protein
MAERQGYSWRTWAVGVLCGAFVVMLVGAATPNSPQATGRYQLQAWAHPAFMTETGARFSAGHGAYRIDTQTGEVISIDENGVATQIEIK